MNISIKSMPPHNLSKEKYEEDEDGLPREIVGPWARDKHTRLAHYIGITRSVRAKYLGDGKAGATYIDFFSGPGRVRIRGENDEYGEVTHGSPLLAWHQSVEQRTPFSEVHVADMNSELAVASGARLKGAGALAAVESGAAINTVDRIVEKLNPHALHLAFLDPYSLAALPFEIIRKLAKLKRMDILIHVSAQDLQRNFAAYMEREDSPLDMFAPGWREHIGSLRNPKAARGRYLEHWQRLLKKEGMLLAETQELIVGTKHQRLYWLAFAARHKQAHVFWEKIRASRQLTLL